MRASGRILGFATVLAIGVAAGIGIDRWWQAHQHTNASEANATKEKPTPDEDEEPEPAAVVRTAIVVAGELPRTIEALGSAVVPPTATTIEAWPSDVLVARILVQPCETVAIDAPLLQVTPTRDAETQLAAAQLAGESTSKALDAVQQRLERGLATKTELLAAQTARDEAKQKLDRLVSGQPPTDGLLRSHAAGTVAAVHVQPGATATAGSPLMDITGDGVVAQLGVDPADAAGVVVGTTFDLRPVDDLAPGRWKGTISLLAHQVNSATRLVDATLVLQGDAPPRPGTPLRARATLVGERGVLVPRAAVVPDGDEFVVFVVRDGTAVRSTVHVSLADREHVVVTSGCAAGDHVIVNGQSQLTQGATVREIIECGPGKTTDSSSGGDGADR